MLVSLRKLFSFPGFLLLPFILLFISFVYFTAVKPIWQFITYHRESATIISCASKTSRNGARYAPVAQTESGVHITGKVFASNSGCISQINDQVTVLLSPNDKTDCVIFTFGQFGVLPLAFIIFSGLFFYARHLNKKRKPA